MKIVWIIKQTISYSFLLKYLSCSLLLFLFIFVLEDSFLIVFSRYTHMFRQFLLAFFLACTLINCLFVYSLFNSLCKLEHAKTCWCLFGQKTLFRLDFCFLFPSLSLSLSVCISIACASHCACQTVPHSITRLSINIFLSPSLPHYPLPCPLCFLLTYLVIISMEVCQWQAAASSACSIICF